MSLTQTAATATTPRICLPFVSFNHPGHPGERNRGLRPQIECNFAVGIALFRSLCFGERRRTNFHHQCHLRNLWLRAALFGLREQPALGQWRDRSIIGAGDIGRHIDCIAPCMSYTHPRRFEKPRMKAAHPILPPGPRSSPARHWRISRRRRFLFGVRLRTQATKRMRVRENALYLVFKLVTRLSLNWRGINAPNQLKLLLAGYQFQDGQLLLEDTNAADLAQPVAA